MRLLILSLTLMLSTMAFAESNTDAFKVVSDNISKAFPKIKIDEIRKAPVRTFHGTGKHGNGPLEPALVPYRTHSLKIVSDRTSRRIQIPANISHGGP